MKKTTVLRTALLTLAVLSFMFCGQEAQTATANPIIYRSFDASPIITVQSPENNTTVAPNGVILDFNLSKPTEDLGGYPYRNLWYDFVNEVVNATYYIDGQPSNVSLEVNSHLQEPVNCSVPLEGLAEGNHTLQIILFCKGVEGLVWMAGGSLNSMEYNCTSEPVNFTIKAPETAQVKAEPLSELAIAGLVACVVIFAVAVWLLFVKRQKAKFNGLSGGPDRI